MNHRFRADAGPIVVSAELSGTDGAVVLRLALDTGATSTVINTDLLVAVGCDPRLDQQRAMVTTGSGVEFLARVRLKRIHALGESRNDFEVLSHTLPPSANVDGLLGLDFLRTRRLTIDFRTELIELV